MKKAALRIGLAVGFAILTAAVSAQAQNSLNIRAQRAVSCNDLGVAMLNGGKLGDAIQLFKEAISLRPDYSIATAI